MNFYLTPLLIGIFLMTLIFLKCFIFVARKKNLLDNQNPNYNFQPTPTGSGIVFVFVFLLSGYFFSYSEIFMNALPNNYYVALISILILGIISFVDDLKPVDPRLRLIAQIFLIYCSITTLELGKLNLPIKISFLIAICIWIYLINITNFIDGSDGFLTSIAISFWLGIILINLFTDNKLFSFYLAIVNLPILFAFLIFNKPKAKIFMGDTGSIFNGFLIGFSFIELILEGYFIYATVIFIYPLLDCTYCLIKKILKGYMPWVGLYDYFFLKPILRNKLNHLKVFIIISIFNLLNIFLLLLSFITDNQYILIMNIMICLFVIFIFNKVKIENYFN